MYESGGALEATNERPTGSASIWSGDLDRRASVGCRISAGGLSPHDRGRRGTCTLDGRQCHPSIPPSRRIRRIVVLRPVSRPREPVPGTEPSCCGCRVPTRRRASPQETDVWRCRLGDSHGGTTLYLTVRSGAAKDEERLRGVRRAQPGVTAGASDLANELAGVRSNTSGWRMEARISTPSIKRGPGRLK